MEGIQCHLRGRFTNGLSRQHTNHFTRLRSRFDEARLDSADDVIECQTVERELGDQSLEG